MRLRLHAPAPPKLFLLLLSIVALVALSACDVTGLPSGATPSPTTASPASSPTVEADAGPTTTAGRTPTTAAGKTPTAGAQATPANTPDTTEANKILTQIEKDTATLRGLAPKADTPETFISEDQLRQNLTTDMEKDYSKDEAKQDAMELWLMRLINDPDIDLYQLSIDLLTEQVAGYYDHKQKELFVRNDGATLSPLSRQTLSHEYTHSLQDQHFDLQKLLPENSTDDDRAMAIRCLVEGDASITMILYSQKYFTPEEFQKMIEESSNTPTNVLDRAPRYMQETLFFPYQQGVEFTLAVAGARNIVGNPNFSNIDKALQDPPSSTEQILHPEKYTRTPRDEPQIVQTIPLTGTLPADWKHIDGGTLGELDFRLMLEESDVTDNVAEQAAAGWGGASYDFYQGGDQSLLIFTTAWDTKRDADEFATALNSSFKQYQKEGSGWTDGRRHFAIKRTGDRITYVASTSQSALDAAVAAVK